MIRVPSRSEVDLLSLGMNEVARQARAELQAFWLTLPKDDLVYVREQLEEFFPSLIDTYGDVASVVAADWYESVMNQPSYIGDLKPEAQVNARMRWAMTAGFDGDVDQALATLQMVTDELVKQFGRDTVMRSASKNGVRYARVPSGSETCAFCLMLASRGYVYSSQAKAGDLVKFHGECDCQIVPDDGRVPDGYDPDALYELYLEAHDPGDTGRQVAKKLRKQLGIK